MTVLVPLKQQIPVLDLMGHLVDMYFYHLNASLRHMFVVLINQGLMDMLMLLELHKAAPLLALAEVHMHVPYFQLCKGGRCKYNLGNYRHMVVHRKIHQRKALVQLDTLLAQVPESDICSSYELYSHQDRSLCPCLDNTSQSHRHQVCHSQKDIFHVEYNGHCH